MHQYLRSIGFSKLTHEKDIDKLLKGYEKRGLNTARRYIDSSEQMWLDIRVPVAERLGLCITGYMGARSTFHRTAYYPYLWSDDETSSARPSVIRRVDGRLFSAIIDDSRVGMTLIYQMDNPFDYLHKCGEGSPVNDKAVSKLAGFCTKGFVLLPSVKAEGSGVRIGTDNSGADVADGTAKSKAGTGEKTGSGSAAAFNPPASSNPATSLNPVGDAAAAMSSAMDALINSGRPQNPDTAPTNYNNSDQEARMSLLEAARSGQTDAIEQLALEEMNTIATLSKRLQNEDIYSIVSSVFMPQGVECDIYLVVGDILKVEKVVNESTKELIFDLTLNVNDMIIHVAINEADLEGEPAVGRRFKGRIWLQGRIEF